MTMIVCGSPGNALAENRALTHLSLVSVGLVGNFEHVRYAQGMREQKELLLQGLRSLAKAIESNNVLISMDLRENGLGPATGYEQLLARATCLCHYLKYCACHHFSRIIEEALKKKPTCLPYVRTIRKYMDWNIARSLFSAPDYPMASKSWLRIRFYRNILRMIEEKRFVLADW